MDAHEEPPVVIQVPINLSQEAPKYKLNVKRKTRHHEVVEVDSFVFRRKRKALTPCQPPPPEPQQPAASPAAIKLGLQFESTSPAAGAARPAAAALQGDGKDSTTAEQEPVAAVGEPAEQDMLEPREAEQQVPPAAEHEAVADDLDMVPATQEPAEPMEPANPPAPPAPQRFSMTPSELVYMVEWALTSELKKLPGMTADSAQKAAAQIREQFATQLQQRQEGGAAGSSAQAAAGGQQQQPGEESGAVKASQVTLLPYQVEQLKATLQEKRNKLLQEEAAWLQLRQQYSDMSSNKSDAAATGEAAEPATDRPAGGEGAEPTAQAATDGAAVNEVAGAAEGAEASAAAADSPLGPVTAQGESTLRSVSLKVEMLAALVSKMEHLISSAEAAARTLQVGYHSEKFKVFPHIHSPAALIKSITQSQPPMP